MSMFILFSTYTAVPSPEEIMYVTFHYTNPPGHKELLIMSD